MKDIKGKTQSVSNDNIVIGRNSVLELIKSNNEIENVLVAKGEHEGSIKQIISLCREKRIIVKDVDKRKLDFMCGSSNHQGVIANIPAHKYSTLDEILDYAQEKNESPFIIICDEIEDSHNLGAIIRTAEACGAHGVIIPSRRSVGLNFAVAKTACGALEYMRVARVTNIAETVEELKEKNIWTYAADMNGQNCFQTDFSGGVALVVGSEGNGVSKLVKKRCDVTVSIPMTGHMESLNASVATGVLMYEVVRQRLAKK